MPAPSPVPPPASAGPPPEPAAAPAVPPSRRRLRSASVLVPITAALAGLLFATSASTAAGTDLRAGRRLQLTELLTRERQQVEQREAQATALRRTVEQVESRAAARDSGVAAAQPAPALELGAGLLPVTGPAVTVSLDDAPSRPGRPALSDDPDDLVVHQQDVQAVVNALWSGGAEAMTLMGQRVVSTSAVRCVGNTVILHGQVYSPPFVVTAVGDPVSLRESLNSDPGVAFFRTYVDRFGLGYTAETERAVQLPAYEGLLELPHVEEPA